MNELSITTVNLAETSAIFVPAWAATLYDLLHELIRGRCRTKEEYERLKLLLDDFMKEVEV